MTPNTPTTKPPAVPQADPLAATLRYIQELARQRFWGFITTKLENGHVVHIRCEQNFKPNELPGITGGKY